MKLHRLLFYIFLFLLPIQTRILYKPDLAHIGWYFDYHLAFFLYLSDILLIGCFTSWLVFDPPNTLKLRTSKLFLAILGFLFIGLVTLLHVKRLDLGIYQWFKWIEFMLLLLYIASTTRSRLNLEHILLILFGSAVFQAILGWVQFHVQHMLGFKLLGEYIPPIGTWGLSTIETVAGKVIRAYGTFPHPNLLAGFLVLGLVCGLFLVSRESRKQSYAILAGIAILIVGIFATFSRVAWLAAALAIICYVGYYLWTKKQSLAATIVLVTIICGTLILSFYQPQLQARVADDDATSAVDRYFFNHLGSNLVGKFPFLGVGVGNYVVALGDLYVLQPWEHQPAHNIFIFVTAELGIVGGGLFILILFLIFSGLKIVPRDDLSFSLAMIGILFLLMGQFDHYFVTIQQGRLMFATVLGLIAALPHIYDDQGSS